MIGSSLTFAACIGYWLAPAQTLPVECVINQIKRPLSIKSLSLNSRSPDWLYEQARSITVKVKANRNSGSGTLVRRQGSTYLVLTNDHVLTPGTPYVIQTPDGRSHPANLVKKINFQGVDLAMLQFRSKATYTIAPLTSTKHLLKGDPVVAAGFPIDFALPKFNRLLVTVGKVSLLPNKAFAGGYQIGYTNLIRQGMSGGPVLNLEGEVVGINSLHAYPLWGDPYIFQDGSKPAPSQRKTIVESSWAVPIDIYRQKVEGKEQEVVRRSSQAAEGG